MTWNKSEQECENKTMKKRQYEDFKYCMQDVSNLFVGVKYTIDELMDDEEIPMKFRIIVMTHITREADREDTLETHLYYLDEKSLSAKIYKFLKARVKISILEEKKEKGNQVSKEYTTQIIPIDQFVKLTPEEKEQKGVVIQELIVSKLAMMAF